MAGVRKSADISQIAARLRLSESSRVPTARDVHAMFAKSKEMPGSIIEWVWTEPTNSRVCTLTAKFPFFRDRDWWDYELKDDPDWCLSDDRAQGNNVIWEYKTSDVDLVVEIVQMMQTNARKAADKARSAEGGQQAATDFGPRSTFSTPVFPELLGTDEPELDPTRNLQQVFPALAYSHFTGKVEICNDDKVGQVFFEYGVPLHAWYSTATGDAAVREIVSWRVGNVSCSQDERTESRSVTRPLDYLLREGIGLLQQKKFLALQGLAYESYLIKTGKGGSATLPEDFVLPKLILDRLHRNCTLTDILRDLRVEPTEWVPALCDLLNRRLLAIRPPAKDRSSAINVLFGLDDQAGNLYSPQTGLYKYEALLTFLQREYQLFKENSTPVSLIVFEMSTKGDRIDQKNQWLSAEEANLIAEKIELLKRPLDVFAHFQMLDFALLLPNTDLAQATFMAERVVHTLTKLPMKPGQKDKSLIVFCGVANLPAQGASLKSLVTAATLAKDQSKEWQWPVVTSQSDHALAERAPYAVHPAFRPARAEHEDQGPVQLQDLLIRSGLVSPENFETAFGLSEKMHMPIARVLSIEGHIHERTVEAAQQVLSSVNEHSVSVDNAIKALQLVGNHGVDLDTALKRLGTVRQTTRQHKLGALLRAAGIIKRSKLEEELRHSASVGLSLGCVLVNKGILSQYTLQASLMILRFINDKSLSREDGIKALKAVHSGSSSLRQYLRDNNIDIAEPVGGLGELLVLGRLISDSELLSAREIELINKRDLDSVLIDQGFVRAVGLKMAKQLLNYVAIGKMSREQAAQILQNNKNRTEMPDLDKLLQVMDQLQKTKIEPAKAEAPKAEAPKVAPKPEAAKPEAPKVAPKPEAAKPEAVAAKFESPVLKVESSAETTETEVTLPLAEIRSKIPRVESAPIEVSGAGAAARPEAPRSESASPPEGPKAERPSPIAPSPIATTAGPTISPVTPKGPPKSPIADLLSAVEKSVDKPATELPVSPAADAKVESQPVAEPRAKPEVQSQPVPQATTPTPNPSQASPPAKARPKTSTIEVDRVKLLRTANIIDDRQIKDAIKISNAHNTSLFRTLFDTGEIDQPAVNLASSAKRHIESGRLDIPKAVIVMRYCKEHNVGFDEAMSVLEGSL